MSSSPSSAHWLSLVGSVWLQTINGPNADFPVYSSQLKEIKGISQVRLNFLAFASDAGKLFGWFAGVAALRLPLWAVALTGAAFGLIGYGVQFLFLDKPGLAYWHLFLLTSLAGNGICWINTVCYLLCIKNFPSDSRVAVSLATSYLGLSAKFYTTMAETLPKSFSARYSTTKVYLLLNAVVPMIVTLVAVPSLRVVELNNRKRTEAPFVAMLAITLATGACAIVGSVGAKSIGLSTREHMVSFYVLLALPLLIPVALKARESIAKIRETKWENRVHDHDSDGAETAVSMSVVELEAEDKQEDQGQERELQNSQEEVGGLRLLRKIDFWLYFFSYMFSGTLGLVFLNNLGQIAESRGLADASTLVSLSSSFGFFGRLLPAFLDYYTAKSGYSLSRTASMASLMAPMSGAFFLLLHPSNMSLYVSTAVVGTCTGAITSVAASATNELFGTKNFGVNHNVVVANIPLGSLCFGYLAAFLYQRGAHGGNLCLGTACYRDSFLLWGATCALGTALCAVLYARSRRSAARRLPR
ncbi:Protein NUCLEAR FUSION DEFECTIVE 4 [Dichanthelium oligosanthes]|uniref:Protein NUCLEAR FUSION DEFECTIVE 4 n=1 Tax=Dichanthelium oligosanthes TaxID=888268 RepID=A0A1E5VEA6_9POAL|nr:Protein NUCLEAR FUSION DEFECTIVE 4 [Dichanthelium oligosanthes]